MALTVAGGEAAGWGGGSRACPGPVLPGPGGLDAEPRWAPASPHPQAPRPVVPGGVPGALRAGGGSSLVANGGPPGSRLSPASRSEPGPERWQRPEAQQEGEKQRHRLRTRAPGAQMGARELEAAAGAHPRDEESQGCSRG